MTRTKTAGGLAALGIAMSAMIAPSAAQAATTAVAPGATSAGAAQVASAQPAASTTCVKATAKHKKAVKKYKKAKRSGTPAQVKKTKRTVVKAKKNRTRACTSVSAGNATAPKTATVTDENGVEYVVPVSEGAPRPPAGSGLPGSNATNVQMTGCPVALSMPATHATAWESKSGPQMNVTVDVYNPSDQNIRAHVTVDAVDADGNRFGNFYHPTRVVNQFGELIRVDQVLKPTLINGEPAKFFDDETTIPGGVTSQGYLGGGLPAATNNLDTERMTITVQVTCL